MEITLKSNTPIDDFLKKIDLEKTKPYINHGFLITKDGEMITSTEYILENPKIFEHQRKLSLKEVVELPKEEYEELKKQVIKLMAKIEENLETNANNTEVDDSTIGIKLNTIIEDAVESGASDVHIVPSKRIGKVYFRIGGIIEEIESLPTSYINRLVTKVKERAGMDTGDSTKPQDGKMNAIINGRPIEIRVSTLPLKVGGEDAVLRIQDSSRILSITLEQLGFEEKDLQKYFSLAQSPYGAIVDVGGTGEGKSTTLYQTIIRLAERFKAKGEEKVILTVEDPVEVDLSEWGVRQVEVKPERGITFANTLRAFLRHDPDVIMVGEIRDKETAETTVQASLTGHLVLSTLHANDSVTAIDRLREFEISPFLIANTFLALLSQRLVRKLCPHCRKKVKVPDEIKREYGLEFDYYYVPNTEGCERCRGGFKGRTAVFELLVMDEELKKLVSSNATTVEIKTFLKDKGWNNLWINGLKKVEKGITSLEELLRKVQPDPIINAVSSVPVAGRPDVGVVLYPERKIKVIVGDKEGYLFDLSHKGISIIFNEVLFLELNKHYKAKVILSEYETKDILVIPKSYKKVIGGKFIVGGTYKGDLSGVIEY